MCDRLQDDFVAQVGGVGFGERMDEQFFDDGQEVVERANRAERQGVGRGAARRAEANQKAISTTGSGTRRSNLQQNQGHPRIPRPSIKIRIGG